MIHQHIIPCSSNILEHMLDCRPMLHAWIGLISTHYPYSKANIWFNILHLIQKVTHRKSIGYYLHVIFLLSCLRTLILRKKHSMLKEQQTFLRVLYHILDQKLINVGDLRQHNLSILVIPKYPYPKNILCLTQTFPFETEQITRS